MPRGDFWRRGDRIVLREVCDGRVWTARPVRVVEDSAERQVLYLAPGTRWKRPVGPDGSWLRLQVPPWHLVDTQWDPATLWVVDRGAPHAVLLFWEPGSWAFRGWYVNLQEPLRRTAVGFDYLDQALDVVVAPDRSWAWKDEDELALAVELGLVTPEGARSIRREGERVVRALEAGRAPFADPWPAWHPEPGWGPLVLLPGWDSIDPGACTASSPAVP